MSTVHLIACDNPLPGADMRIIKNIVTPDITIQYLSGFWVGSESRPHGFVDDSDIIINKKYKYEIGLETDAICLEQLKLYLSKNMKNGSEVEIWSIGLGGDYTKHYRQKIPTRHIPPDKAGIVDDEIDRYTEISAVPTKRRTTIDALTKNDISFLLENLSVCITVNN